MSNPHEVDVSKEDIATTDEVSQAEAEFFGLHTSTGSTEEEEGMPAARTRRTRPVEEQPEENLNQVAGPNLIVNSPRHLWGLGSFKIHYRVEDAEEMGDALQDAQKFFEWAEDEFTDRLADVAALENRISEAQKELLNTLAEELGEDLPDLTDYSKTEASKLIRELLATRESKPQPKATSSRRPRGTSRRTGGTSRRPTSRKRTTGTGSRASSTGTRGGRRTGGGSRRSGRRNFNNDAPGSATDKMKDFLLDLCRQAGTDAPTDDELDNQMTFNDVSVEITELREALGYEDN